MHSFSLFAALLLALAATQALGYRYKVSVELGSAWFPQVNASLVVQVRGKNGDCHDKFAVNPSLPLLRPLCRYEVERELNCSVDGILTADLHWAKERESVELVAGGHWRFLPLFHYLQPHIVPIRLLAFDPVYLAGHAAAEQIEFVPGRRIEEVELKHEEVYTFSFNRLRQQLQAKPWPVSTA